MLASVLTWVIAICCSLLFVTAGLHKLADLPSHRAQMADYRVLPQALLAPVSQVLPWVELAVGFGWLVPVSRTAAASVAAFLLLVYALAMAVNLARGRHHVSCGCGTTTGGDSLISPWLVGRNLALACLALWAAWVDTPAGWGWLHTFTVVLGASAMIVLYGAAHQLLANADAISQWRVRRG